MKTDRNLIRVLKVLAVWVAQLIMSQVVTFLLSFLTPDVEKFQRSLPWLFALLLGLAFFVGIFFTGWLGIKIRWMVSAPKTLARLLGTLIGVCLPLLAGVLIYGILEAGNPFFFISMWMGILGFHLPGWMRSGK